MYDQEIHYPTGYAFVLMEVVIPGHTKRYVCDLDPVYVKDKRKWPEDSYISPVKLSNLISTMGHTGANKFLKKFGDEWCAKRGHIFYKDRV